jgi:hypothetical protein
MHFSHYFYDTWVIILFVFFQKQKKNKDANGCALKDYGKHAVISFCYFRLGAVYK